VQAFLTLLWRSRLFIAWLVLQVLTLAWYVQSVQFLRQRWLITLESVTVALHKGLDWLAQPVIAIRLYKSLEAQNSQLLEALALHKEVTGPVSMPLGAWSRLTPNQSYRFVPTHCLYQTIHAQQNYLLIDKGGRDSLYPGLCVINNRGIVGFIAETSHTHSRVLSLFHHDVHLAIQLASSEYLGLSVWDGNSPLNELEVIYVPFYARVEVGEEVWSAPQSTLCPGGLRLGRVVESYPEIARGFQRLRVRTYADWFRLGPLYVVKPLSPTL